MKQAQLRHTSAYYNTKHAKVQHRFFNVMLTYAELHWLWVPIVARLFAESLEYHGGGTTLVTGSSGLALICINADR